MEKILKKYRLGSVNGKNELCDCRCDLFVTDLLVKETTNKVDEITKKFTPYNFIAQEYGAYCPECKSLYYIKSLYEASSKTDWEDTKTIEKVSYFDNMINFRNLVKKESTEESFNLYVDGVDVQILKIKDTDKSNQKIIYYKVIKNDNLALNKMNNKCCYKCDDKIIIFDEDGTPIKVECDKYGLKEFDDVCEEYLSFFDDDDIEELNPSIFPSGEDVREAYNFDNLKL